MNIQKGVTQLSHCDNQDFEDAYLDARQKEQRLLDDQAVLILPKIEKTHPHYKEWKIREHSANKFLIYLQEKNLSKTDRILDIGCGNGWFSYLLAKSEPAQVLAIDINKTELVQAARIFHCDNLAFAYLDMMVDSLEVGRFSQIIFNSSFQYFDQPKKIIDLCLNLLVEEGEIHIIDSPLYEPDGVESAELRSLEYYQAIDSLEMNAFYHHHNRRLLDDYQVEYLYQPAPEKSEREENDSPFSWFKIGR